MLIGSHQWGIDADTAGTISTGGGMIRRASMNSHNWYGVISNLEYTTGNIKMSAGVDLRDYTGYHYRALNNLMGFDAYYSGGNRNNEGQIIESTIEASPFSNTGLVGPKIDYFNVGRVQWAGLNGMIEYNDQEKLTAVMQAGWSQQNYRRIDYFDQPGNHISDWSRLNGGYIKGGANYNLNEEMNIFFNAGLIARQPLFDAVFPGFANDVNPDLENEIIQSFELGYAYITNDLQVNINVYNTNWGNRFVSNSFDYAFQDTIMIDDAVIQAKGIDVVHSGLELEAKYQASSKLRLNTMLSIGNWRYTSDINVDVFDDNRNMIENTTLYTNGAKVGDAAQTTMFIGVDYNIAKNLTADIGFRYVDDLYADYSLVNSEFLKENNEGALQLPSFSLIDMGLTSRFELAGNMASLRLNVNNVANTMYIAESNSNIHAAAGDDTWNGISTANYVWMGFGRTWNATFRYNF
jgi:opacity protein-like surface antigen